MTTADLSQAKAVVDTNGRLLRLLGVETKLLAHPGQPLFCVGRAHAPGAVVVRRAGVSGGGNQQGRGGEGNGKFRC